MGDGASVNYGIETQRCWKLIGDVQNVERRKKHGKRRAAVVIIVTCKRMGGRNFSSHEKKYCKVAAATKLDDIIQFVADEVFPLRYCRGN